MDAAGSERAALIAHGHAAQMALLFAATHPDRVASLVLINGFARLLAGRGLSGGDAAGGCGRRCSTRSVETLGNRRDGGVLGPSVPRRRA